MEVKAMLSEALNITGTSMQKMPRASEQIDVSRKKTKEEPDKSQENTDKNAIPPEELLDQIKALTENGIYSVRFENDERSQALVVKIVDSETNEVIRQVPAEEILGLRKALTDFQGNFVDTTS
jgi:flagellar protein FlaG